MLDKAGAFFKYKGETIGQGREAVKKLFKEKPELMDEIEKEVRARALPHDEHKDEPTELTVKSTSAKADGVEK